MKTFSFLIWTYPWKFHCVVSTFWQRCQRQRGNYVENRLLTLSPKLNIEQNFTCRLGKYSRQKTVLWIISFPSFSRFFLKPNAPVVCRIKVSISYSHSYFFLYLPHQFQLLTTGQGFHLFDRHYLSDSFWCKLDWIVFWMVFFYLTSHTAACLYTRQSKYELLCYILGTFSLFRSDIANKYVILFISETNVDSAVGYLKIYTFYIS